ncbi:MAG: hypothetical protein ACXW3X_14445 [Rhodoplanes sp.]
MMAREALVGVDAFIQTLGVSPSPALIFTGMRLFSTATRSRRAKNCCGQQFLDHGELPSAFRLPNRALWERVVLVLDSGISFVPFALDPLQLRRDFLGSEHPPDLGDESRQLLREGAMLGRGFGKIQQFLVDKIIESRLESVAIFDRAGGLALLNPDFVQLSRLYHSPSP